MDIFNIIKALGGGWEILGQCWFWRFDLPKLSLAKASKECFFSSRRGWPGNVLSQAAGEEDRHWLIFNLMGWCPIFSVVATHASIRNRDWYRMQLRDHLRRTEKKASRDFWRAKFSITASAAVEGQRWQEVVADELRMLVSRRWLELMKMLPARPSSLQSPDQLSDRYFKWSSVYYEWYFINVYVIK